VENTVLGATYVYSSASEPNQETGAFRNRHDFVCALLDPRRESNSEMMIYGGDYASSKDLRLDLIFPVDQSKYNVIATSIIRRIVRLHQDTRIQQDGSQDQEADTSGGFFLK